MYSVSLDYTSNSKTISKHKPLIDLSDSITLSQLIDLLPFLSFQESEIESLSFKPVFLFFYPIIGNMSIHIRSLFTCSTNCKVETFSSNYNRILLNIVNAIFYIFYVFISGIRTLIQKLTTIVKQLSFNWVLICILLIVCLCDYLFF